MSTMYYKDAKWRDVPRLLALLVAEVQGLRSDIKSAPEHTGKAVGRAINLGAQRAKRARA